ncbi:MAG TPA: AAA family ATPase [Patescibacteria group bacterium]|nr:AAA family ATPase [Patescibacteria group bacterium]
MKTLIAIVGLPGSGKTEAADYFRKHGFTVLRFGDQTDIGVKELGLPLTEENERRYREQIRKEFGMAAMAIKIEPRILKAIDTSDMIALDGMRSWEEYVYLKEKFPQLLVLSIFASPKARYNRLANRRIRPLTESESKERDKAEIENLHSGGPIALADYVIKNEGTKPDLERALSSFLQTLS